MFEFSTFSRIDIMIGIGVARFKRGFLLHPTQQATPQFLSTIGAKSPPKVEKYSI
jgi:hypothetical protein